MGLPEQSPTFASRLKRKLLSGLILGELTQRYKTNLEVYTQLATRPTAIFLYALLCVVPHQPTFFIVVLFLVFKVVRFDEVFLALSFFSRLAFCSRINLLNSSSSFFVRGLLLITKSTPSGSLISPMALFFKIFVN